MPVSKFLTNNQFFQIVAVMQYARPRVTRQQFMTLFVGGLTLTGGLAIVVYFALVWGGNCRVNYQFN